MLPLWIPETKLERKKFLYFRFYRVYKNISIRYKSEKQFFSRVYETGINPRCVCSIANTEVGIIDQSSYGLVTRIRLINFQAPTRLIFRQLIEDHSTPTLWVLSGFLRQCKEEKRNVCILPNANFTRDREREGRRTCTLRGLIALARTNCNQRRDCDNICPVRYSNTDVWSSVHLCSRGWSSSRGCVFLCLSNRFSPRFYHWNLNVPLVRQITPSVELFVIFSIIERSFWRRWGC